MYYIQLFYGVCLMFYENLLKLCNQRGISLTHLVTKEIKMSVSNVTKWKEGKVPKSDTVKKIADYFGVSTDYLLSESDSGQSNSPIVYSDEAMEYLEELDARPEMKMLFKTAKGVSKDDIEQVVKLIERFKNQSN